MAMVVCAAAADAGNIVLENPVSNMNTNIDCIDNTGYFTMNDMLGQSFTAPANRLISARMMLYAEPHPAGGRIVCPEVRFLIFGADDAGHIDVNNPAYTGPRFTIPGSVNHYYSAAFFSLGNVDDVWLQAGRNYYFAVSVRDNRIPNSEPVVVVGGDVYGVDKFPGHVEVVSVSNTVRPYSESVDAIFRLEFVPVPEPSSLLALVSGLAGLGGVFFRRRRR